MSSSNPILIAIPGAWSSQVCQHFAKKGISVIATYSKSETLAIIRQKKDLRGLIIVSDWAMSDKNDTSDGIIKLVKGKIPTITIITDTSRQNSGYLYMDEVFFPPSHEYISAPLAIDELEARMQKIGM